MDRAANDPADAHSWWVEEHALSPFTLPAHAFPEAMYPYAALAGVASNMSSGLILLDREEHVAYSNPSAERLLGISCREMLELPVFDVRAHLLTLATDRDGARAELDRLWLHPEQELAADFALSDALVRWLRVRSFPVKDEPGRMLGRGLLFDDVTLERASNQARGETLALAAHELKTPLAIIKGCATTLLGNASRWDPVTLREMLQMIDTQTDRLHDVLNTLLDVWRLDAGVQQLRLTEVRLDDVLAHLLERWRENAPRHTFSLRLPQEPVLISCDALRIEQAIHHLLSNAVLYSQPGSAIKIQLDSNEDEARLSVSDQGIGIAPENLERIFDRFYRVQHGAHNGNGLGLAVVRSIIEAHGGSIWAESAGIGRGATLHFTLPFAPVVQARLSQQNSQNAASTMTSSASTATTSTLPRPTGAPRSSQRVKVIVVENDQRVARYLRANLEEQHYRVQIATYGLQFLRQLDLEEPDLILLASDAGDIAGSELLQRLREFASIPVLMLCDNDNEDEHVSYLDMGADDFVVKPFSMKELLARVRVLLRRRLTPGEAAASDALFTTGDLTMDFSQRQVFVEGRVVQLSRTEYKLLHVLAQNAGRVLTHELLLERVWGAEYQREVDFIWVYISRLRRKIESDPRHPRYILTVPDVGYKLAKL